MAYNNKALLFLLFGTFAIFLGTGVICGGGFNSVMFSPTKGPYLTTRQSGLVTTGTNINTGTGVNTGTNIININLAAGTSEVDVNLGHYTSLLKQHPEMFNWDSIDALRATIDQGAQESGIALTDSNSRFAANAYTKYHAGEQAWIFAFYLPLGITVVILAFTAYLRKSGYTLALAGLGLSSVLLAYTIIIVVHYQNVSFVPEALNAFADCDSGTLITNRSDLSTDVAFGTLYGPVPRRAWLCKEDWTYDNDFRVAANLVWGGAATAFFGYFSLIIGFAYLVQPFVQPQTAFKPYFAYQSYRGADVDFDDYSDDYSDNY